MKEPKNCDNGHYFYWIAIFNGVKQENIKVCSTCNNKLGHHKHNYCHGSTSLEREGCSKKRVMKGCESSKWIKKNSSRYEILVAV